MLPATRFPVTALFLMGLATTTFTAGCTNQPYTSPEQQAQNACQAFGPKTLSGALVGGLGGAAGGAGIGALAGGGRGAAIGAGVGLLAGLISGMIVGHDLDARDCVEAQTALVQIRHMRTGQPSAWQSPSGSYGSYTPITDEYAGSAGQVCRKIRQDTTLKGREATSADVITCRGADGDYHTVSAVTD